MIEDDRQRPCIALMGEFSAGKSTLANLLIGTNPLPVQVVATQLPPVCISYGEKAPYCVDLEGQHQPIDLDNLRSADLDQIAYIQIFCVEDILLQCDLLDMPGISDPNMSADVWRRMIDAADGVLWCSHATQAWRQSEAAVWAELSQDLRAHSLLLLTRIDKLQSDEDRARVLKRVKKETAGLFADVLPISLLLATQEQADYQAWSASGAEKFAERLVELLAGLNQQMAAHDLADPSHSDLRLPGLEGPEQPQQPSDMQVQAAPKRVMPRRVRHQGSATDRPGPH